MLTAFVIWLIVCVVLFLLVGASVALEWGTDLEELTTFILGFVFTAGVIVFALFGVFYLGHHVYWKP